MLQFKMVTVDSSLVLLLDVRKDKDLDMANVQEFFRIVICTIWSQRTVKNVWKDGTSTTEVCVVWKMLYVKQIKSVLKVTVINSHNIAVSWTMQEFARNVNKAMKFNMESAINARLVLKINIFIKIEFALMWLLDVKSSILQVAFATNAMMDQSQLIKNAVLLEPMVLEINV